MSSLPAYLYFLPFGWAYQALRPSCRAGSLALYEGVLLRIDRNRDPLSIPISVNGIGLREQLHYLLFGSLGVSRGLLSASR